MPSQPYRGRRGRRLRYPPVALAVQAGSWRANPRAVSLLRPPSPGIELYQRLVNVPIGNDGVAFPVVFSAAGKAQAFAGPTGVGTSWQPAQAAVYTSLGQSDPSLATVFAGPLPISQYQVASLLAGGAAQVPLAGVTLVPGWFIWAAWTGGTPGATGFLNVTGLKSALITG